MRVWLHSLVAVAGAALLVGACGARTLDAGPGGEGAFAAAGGSSGAGAGHNHGGGSVGGGSSSSTSSTSSSGSSTSSSGSSTSSSGTPIDCITCIGTNCPDALACVQDQGCVQGMVCAVSQCMGGGGSPDMMCVLDCFNGDMQAALLALNTITCIFGSCGQECGGLLPGPGG